MRTALTLLTASLTPALFCLPLWSEVWRGVSPQAWDGSGHYALARIYTDTLFPNTFGWASAYFAGMGFPNYYPPLFYWLVALLTRSRVLSFTVAFKLVLVLPVLLLPASVWLVSRRLFREDRLTSACAALALLPLLVDERFTNSAGVMGLSYTSTFMLGLYTQPLGFVLLLAWYYLYSSPDIGRGAWRPALAALLLALALLANFFGATTAALFILTTVAYDVWRLRTSSDKSGALRALAAHLLSPLVSSLLTLFWLAPLLRSYTYVVTRPQYAPFSELFPAPLVGWYALCIVGAVVALRARKSEALLPYTAACLLLATSVLFGAVAAPRWFPFHPPRLTSTLNFLLAPFAGCALAAAARALGFGAHAARAKSRRGRKGKAHTPDLFHAQSAVAAGVVASIGAFLLVALINPPRAGWAFYDEAAMSRLSPVLDFARAHRDGRYLVEVQPVSDVDAAHEGRAINAYLGAQGNETTSLFFREAAPNVLFLNPLTDSLSTTTDAYGISSVLADDTDYAAQPLLAHLAQARLFGVKYLLMRSPAMKDRLAREGGVTRYDLGRWSVFELADVPPPVRALEYRPALVVGPLSFKLRRRNDYGFVRLAEEQFASGWYDVPLALSPETRLDRIDVPTGFGALVVDDYNYGDQDRAFERLRDFARTRPLVLLSSDDPLFSRIKASAAEFPQLEIIERQREDAGPWLESDRPTTSYAASGPRRAWSALRAALERHKVSVAPPPGAVTSSASRQAIDIDASGASGEVPVLVATTFHPDWRRPDGEAIYPASPFFMLSFVRGQARLAFGRGTAELAAVYASAAALLLLCAGTAFYHRRELFRLRGLFQQDVSADSEATVTGLTGKAR